LRNRLQFKKIQLKKSVSAQFVNFSTMKRPAATIKDIANKLLISPSTVSRALKDHAEISQETKDAVKRVAEELNYRPNTLALNLRYSRTNTIGIVIPEIVHFFFSTVISGIDDYAQSHGFNVIITQTNESTEREILNLQTLFNTRVDGIVISLSRETTDFSHLEQLIQKGVPVVFFDRAAEGVKCSRVIVDDFLGGYQATSHLIEQGYKKIAHLAGPTGLELTSERLEGYKKALADHQLPFDEHLVVFDQVSDRESAAKATTQLLKDHNPDALFAANDIAAMGAIQAAQKFGRAVPYDFGVVGFSNWQFTALTVPSISTIEQPGYEMGQHAAELLIRQIEAEDESEHPIEIMKLPTRLIARDSSNRQK
jgi:LacI family transcriptional regulator